MAKADKVFKFVEFKYLTEISEVLGITATQLDELMESNNIAPIPKKNIDRARQIYRLAVMMKIDHIIVKEEIKLLKEYAVELGLNPEGIDIMLERMDENKGGMLLDKDLCNIFSISLN
jgi:tellurite resistance protein